MADNVPVTAGSGTNIATDDRGADGHFQRVPIEAGRLDRAARPPSPTPRPWSRPQRLPWRLRHTGAGRRATTTCSVLARPARAGRVVTTLQRRPLATCFAHLGHHEVIASMRGLPRTSTHHGSMTPVTRPRRISLA